MSPIRRLDRKTREVLCARCPTPCAGIMLADPRACCPLSPPRWGPVAPAPESTPLGLGDLVAIVAEPAAAAIDTVARTDLQHCLGCLGRHGGLNRAVPDVRRPWRRSAR